MTASPFALKKLRSPQELAEARQTLIRNGYRKDTAGAWVKMPDCCLKAIEQDEGEGIASCTFGCGSRIDDDHKMCLHCRDHSANEMECEQGHTLAKWGDDWERMA